MVKTVLKLTNLNIPEKEHFGTHPYKLFRRSFVARSYIPVPESWSIACPEHHGTFVYKLPRRWYCKLAHTWSRTWFRRLLRTVGCKWWSTEYCR